MGGGNESLPASYINTKTVDTKRKRYKNIPKREKGVCFICVCRQASRFYKEMLNCPA